MPHRIADVVVLGWALLAATGGGVAAWIRGLDSTWKNLMVLFGVMALTVMGTLAFQERAHVLGTLPAQMEQDRARTDTIRAEVMDSMGVLLDSIRDIAGEAARRADALRELLGQTNRYLDSIATVQRDLLCSLEAVAEGSDPQEECRPARPLPVVPRLPPGGAEPDSHDAGR